MPMDKEGLRKLQGPDSIIEYDFTELRHLRRALAIERLGNVNPEPIAPSPRPTAVDVAVQEWLKYVGEERDHEYIYDTYCVGNLGCTDAWRWLPWDGPGKEWAEGWCGAFVAYCHGVVGLSAGIRRHLMPSPTRLLDRPRAVRAGLDFNFRDRLVDVEAVRADDVLCVDTHGGRRPDHVALCVAGRGQGVPEDLRGVLGIDSVPDDADWCATVEGNAHGAFPDGSDGVGVITRLRPHGKIRAAIRFTKEDVA